MKKTTKEITDEAYSMQVLIVHGHKHVIRPFDHDPYPQPDYRGTGMALCGVLREGQTLDHFRNDWIKMQRTFEERSMDVVEVKRRKKA